MNSMILKYGKLFEEEVEDDSEDWEDVIIGKDGDYELTPEGDIVIVKKETGGEGSEGGGGGDSDEDDDGEKGKGGKGKKGKKGDKSDEDGDKEPSEEEDDADDKDENDSAGDEGDDDVDEDSGDWDDIPAGSGTKEMDDQYKRVTDRMSKGKDLDDKEAADEEERQRQEEKSAKDKLKGGGGGRGAGKDNRQGIDYTKIRPEHNWEKIISMFIASAGEEWEETYARPSRKSIQSMHVAAQTGKGAMKPGELVEDAKDIRLAFVVDSSGSMGSVIETVYANIAHLLGASNKYDKTVFTLIKFSDSYQVWKGMWAPDLAGQAPKDDILDVPVSYDRKMSEVFKEHYGSTTNFGATIASDIKKLLDAKYNVIIFSDSDLSDGANGEELKNLIKHNLGKVFALFDNRGTWLHFRKFSRLDTANISYINESEKFRDE